MPNCIIVGAQKAGTSSLYQYLTLHPEIHCSLKKEIHYFDGGLNPNDDDYQKGVNWYKAHFPLEAKISKDSVCVEATPMYLFNPLVPSRIHKLIPDCKIIILLRNPVERAISHYFHAQRHNHESLSIEKAIAAEETRLENIYNKNNYKDIAFRVYSYKARGLYLKQILRYQKYFGNEKILILDSNELYKTPHNTLQKVYDFLNIMSDFQPDEYQPFNVGNNKQAVSSEIHMQLEEYFKIPNRELFKHLGCEFDW